MAKIDLTKYGISNVGKIVYNPSYEDLFKAEMDPSLTGYDKGQLTELDAVNVMTGIYTGRSPKDKYIVDGKTAPEDSAVASAVKQELESAERFTSMTMFNEFVGRLEKGTPVESNLDLFYKE